MKLQYRYFEHVGFKYIIRLYCDGWLVKSYKVYLDELDDEIDKIQRVVLSPEEIDKIEKQGYTYGYTEDELDKARAYYENVLDNVIRK